MGLKTKIIGIVTSVILLAVLGFFFFRYYFVFGEGVKAGELNQVMYKGYVFKTYEGRLIQAGFRGASSSKGTVTMESYVFEFSVEDKAVADSLMRCSGKSVELHYKEYLGALPWRGQQKYVVDKILSVK
ncbi:MAG: hypothetical protein SPK38_06625 [Candidatus Cryptobacteroides sp.]|nr:hypothetical protein [Candidatus Cryptobacteroides sp.]